MSERDVIVGKNELRRIYDRLDDLEELILSKDNVSESEVSKTEEVFSLTPKPLTTITLSEGEQLQVADFPLDIKEIAALYDVIKQREINARVDLSIAEMSLAAVTQRLGAAIAKWKSEQNPPSDEILDEDKSED